MKEIIIINLNIFKKYFNYENYAKLTERGKYFKVHSYLNTNYSSNILPRKIINKNVKDINLNTNIRMIVKYLPHIKNIFKHSHLNRCYDQFGPYRCVWMHTGKTFK